MGPPLRSQPTWGGISMTSNTKKSGFTPATPARPNETVNSPAKNAAIPVNRPMISAMPIAVSPRAITFEKTAAGPGWLSQSRNDAYQP